MEAIAIVSVIIGYTSFVIYKRVKNIKAGKSCCGGCSSCPLKDKCH